MLDSRFELPGNQNGLSKWVRPHILPDEGFGKSYQALIRFYANAKQKEDAARQEILPPALPDRPTNVSVILRYEDEGKENQQSVPDMDGEEISKVAFIGQPPSNPEQIEEHSPTESYIPSQRIIARVDITTSEGSRKASEVLGSCVQEDEIPSSLSMSPTPSSLPSNADQDLRIYSKSPPPAAPDVAEGPKIIRGTPPPSSAMRFFQLVQATVSQDEFAEIKKAVVLMKKYTQQKHRKEFLAAACGVLQILLTHRTFQNQSRDQKPELLMLLLQLLPKHFIKDGEMCTMDLVFRMSPIRDELKSSLPPDEYIKIHEKLVAVLWGLWFSDGGVDAPDYAKRLGQLLAQIMENGSTSFSSLSHVINIVPSEVRQVTIALLDQLKASMNVTKFRELEKARTGENAVRVERFRKSYFMNPKLADDGDDATSRSELEKSERKSSSTEGSNPSTDSTVNDKNIGPDTDDSKSQDVRRQKQISSSNPYAQNKNPYSTGLRRSGTAQVPAKTTRKGDIDHNHVDEARPRMGGLSLKKILRLSEEEMFTGIRPSKILKLSSNAPTNLSCTICEHPLEKPYISDCGHMACLKCWQQWLSKSQTCPVCRKPASSTSIAFAVFQDTKR